MTAMSLDVDSSPVLTVPYRHDGWTVDDLPGNVDFRYELVDGALIMSPAPELRHDDLSAQALLTLTPLLPPGYRAALAPGLLFDPRNWRQPDLLVYRTEAVRRNRADAADALLVVEVMSPSSMTTDRIVKPLQFAAAGIAHYWRFEFDPLTLIAHALDGDAYREVGRFAEEVVLDQPFPVRFRLADLLP